MSEVQTSEVDLTTGESSGFDSDHIQTGGQTFDLETTATLPDTTWSLREGEPFETARPDFYPEGKTLEEVVKGYTESENNRNRAEGLRKQLGENKGAPEEYAVNVDKEVRETFGYDDDPLAKQFNSVAKELNLPQESYDKILDFYYSGLLDATHQQIENESKAMEELGFNREETTNQIANWSKINYPDDVSAKIQEIAGTSMGMKTLKAIMAQSANANNITGNIHTNNTSLEDEKNAAIQDLMNFVPGSNERFLKAHGKG